MERPQDAPFQLSGRKIYFGPNPLAKVPVVAVGLKAADGLHTDAAARVLDGKFPRLLADLPVSGAGEPPAVALARLVAVFAKNALNETRGFVEAAGAKPTRPGSAVLWVGFHDPKVAISALELSARAVREALGGTDFPSRGLMRAFDDLQELCRNRHPDFQARILMVAAKARDVPVLPLMAGSRLWQFGWGSRSRSFFETASDADGIVGTRIAQSKTLSKTIMQGLGLPTPVGVLVGAPEELAAAAAKVGWPCVAKPVDNGGGRGVTAGIKSLPDLEQSFAYARKFSPSPVLVEAFVPGEDHRLTVIDGTLVVATRREASTVAGDGVRTVRDLLRELNSRRSGNLVASGYLVPIREDPALLATLGRQGLTLGDVPADRRRVMLRSNANRSTGGVCFNVEDIHPEIREMAETFAKTLGLFAAGIDYITPDISKPPSAANGAFIEINASPGLAALVLGGMDETDIGSRLLGALPGRIPFILVVAARSAWVEIAPALASAAAKTPGLAWLCRDEAGLGTIRLGLGRLPMPDRVAALLKHRGTSRAVVVWSLEDLQEIGMPVDRTELTLLYREKTLPAPWQAVVASASARLGVASSAAELVAAALRQAG